MSQSSVFKCKHCSLIFSSANSRNYHQHSQCTLNPKVQTKKAKTLQASKFWTFIESNLILIAIIEKDITMIFHSTSKAGILSYDLFNVKKDFSYFS